MKKIIAVIRNEKVEETKSALKHIGVNGFTFLHVTGRGRQNGRIQPKAPLNLHTYSGKRHLQHQDASSVTMDPGPQPAKVEKDDGFLPKRMLIVVANDNDVKPIIEALIKINQTGHFGDGKIFVCPMISAIRVRNGEQGDHALA